MWIRFKVSEEAVNGVAFWGDYVRCEHSEDVSCWSERTV